MNILTWVWSWVCTEPSSFSSLFNLPYSKDIHYFSPARHISHSTTYVRRGGWILLHFNCDSEVPAVVTGYTSTLIYQLYALNTELKYWTTWPYYNIVSFIRLRCPKHVLLVKVKMKSRHVPNRDFFYSPRKFPIFYHKKPLSCKILPLLDRIIGVMGFKPHSVR